MLTRAIQSDSEVEALATQNRAIEISLVLTLPAAVGLLILANPIAAVLYERGSFTVSDREAVGAALAAFAAGLPAYVLIKALVPGFFGRQDTATPVKIAACAMAMNVVLNLILMGPLGHVGIALATALSAWLNAVLLWQVLMRRGHLVADHRLKTRLPRIVLAAAGMGLAVWVADNVLSSMYGELFGNHGVAAAAEFPRALALVALISVGAAIYGVLLMISGGASLDDLKSLRRQPQPNPRTDGLV